jgi:hypothetical protein
MVHRNAYPDQINFFVGQEKINVGYGSYISSSGGDEEVDEWNHLDDRKSMNVFQTAYGCICHNQTCLLNRG